MEYAVCKTIMKYYVVVGGILNVDAPAGNTITLRGEFYKSHTLTDAEDGSIKLLVKKGDAATEAALTPPKIATGVYEYDYPVPSDSGDAVYSYRFEGTIDGKPVSAEGTFESTARTVEAPA